MNRNGHESRWTCLAATTSRDEGRERGRPARTTLAQRHPSPRPGSTGNGATIPLQPSPWGSHRQGGRAPHHGETERPPNAEDAGETPALPEGRLLPSFLLGEEALPLPMRQCRSASRAFVVLRVSSVKHPIVNKDEPRMDTNTNGPALLQRRHGRKPPPGARASRPHNTGTVSPLSPTRLDQQRRHDSASAEPMGFPAAG